MVSIYKEDKNQLVIVPVIYQKIMVSQQRIYTGLLEQSVLDIRFPHCVDGNNY